MTANNLFLVLSTLSVILLCSAEEPQVSCVFNESCVLPCSFQSGPDPVIYWLKPPADVAVHSYYFGRAQLSQQNQDFKGRTSLFEDQFSRGNASLLLREVKVQDEGTYKCFTSTAHTEGNNSFINLTVRAPVSFVNIEQRGDELICSSKDIYPKPDVSWSLRPPPPDVKTKTSEKGLYSIFSSVTLSHKPPEEHSCNISTDHSWSSATYRLQHPRSISGNEVTVPCSASNAPIKSLIWKFNHTRTILTQTGTNRVYNESWRQFVEEVSESGRLILKNLSSGHQGVYSCVLSSDRETLISSTEVRDPPYTTLYVVLGVFLFIIIFIILIVSVLWWKRQKVLQCLRKIEKRLGEIKEEKKKLKKEKESLEGYQPELADLVFTVSCQIKPPLDRTKTEESEKTRAAEKTSLPELRGGNQLISELLSQVLQHLRKIEKRLGEIKEETKKLKKEKESLEDQRRRKLFPEKDRSKDGPEKVEASAETLLNLNELTRGNQPPSEQVSKRLKEIRERLKEIKEETESLRANPVRELFSEKDRSPSDRPEMSADTQTGGNLRTSKLPSQVLQRLREVEQHLEKLKQEQRNLEEETQLLKDQRLRELFPDDSSPSDGSVQ